MRPLIMGDLDKSFFVHSSQMVKLALEGKTAFIWDCKQAYFHC